MVAQFESLFYTAVPLVGLKADCTVYPQFKVWKVEVLCWPTWRHYQVSNPENMPAVEEVDAKTAGKATD